ncbi:acyl-CoA dehydrogenase family protein [Rhizobium paknamense]|uniref:Alkylation response protein AidB-like acyl-CoA dehydrogenase n=1 Tax=Rhizobium paknamense TaxID=1206817 RepID=A0ABU0IFD7_9HYPH|nr:acyl-CoA dehydrogenase family protein [Rhizobium paknamense]MDQ0456412.1 alkylation response protein AidB-like acyl-CoA dehydrogenase [Rhizobium paknamense]
MTDMTILPYLEHLSAVLGDPLEADQPFSYAKAVAADLQEDPLDEQAALLIASGFPAQLIPAHWQTGGQLRNLSTILDIARRLAGRNPSLMPRLMYSIGAIVVLDLAGTEAQRALLSEWFLAGRSISLAVNEPDIRSDVMNNRTVAERKGDWYIINGRKWLAGQASRARGLMVLARTGAAGPAGSSLFLIDRQPQWESTLPGPRASLTGMRGIDVADVDIDVACVNASARVGQEGEGIELVFRAESIIKLLSIGAMIGPCESALKLAYDEIASQPHGVHPHQKLLLSQALTDFQVMETVARAAARFASFRPQHFPIAAAVAKQIAQEFSGRILSALLAALGARSVLASNPAVAMIQKFKRDVEVAHFMDINPQVNLGMLANQLPMLAKRRAGLSGETADALYAKLIAELSSATPCPDMEMRKVPMLNRGGEPLTDLLPGLGDRIAAEPGLADDDRQAVRAALGKAVTAFTALEEGLAALAALKQGERPEAVNAGAQFSRLFSVSCVVLSWLAASEKERKGMRLPALLNRLMEADPYAFSGPYPYLDDGWERLRMLSSAH